MWRIPRAWEDLLDVSLLDEPWRECQKGRYYPAHENVLRAFEAVKTPADVRVAIVGQVG